MLQRGRNPQEEVAGKAEEGQGEDEADRPGVNSAEGAYLGTGGG
jgi:hypothetical protein